MEPNQVLNSRSIIVHKFGGGCLQKPEAVKQLANILKQYDQEKLIHIVVVSAFGKTTNILEQLSLAALRHESSNAQVFFNQLLSFHLNFIETLFQEGENKSYLEQQIHSTFDELNRIIEGIALLEDFPPRIHDRIMAFGERWSYRIVSAYLKSEGFSVGDIDARQLIITEATHTEAQVLWDSTRSQVEKHLLPLLERYRVIVVPGYIASTSDGRTTTLGREGSDYTASILANLTNAKQVCIWKNVPGVLTADPQKTPDAKRYSYLSYIDAATMSFFGAKVLHPKTVAPLAQKSIPLYIRSFEHPGEEGTVITARTGEDIKPMAYTTLSPLYWIQFYHKTFRYFDSQLLHELLEIFHPLHLHILKVHSNGVKGAILIQTDQENIALIRSILSDAFHITELLPVTLHAYLFVNNGSGEILVPSTAIWMERSKESLFYITPLSTSSTKEAAFSDMRERN